MKYLLTLALAAMVFTGCEEIDAKEKSGSGAQTESGTQTAATQEPASLTSIQWIDSVRNFGKITEGQELQVSFRFKNTGTKPLIIESVRPSCGCTAAAPPDKPILPGEEGTINASFNSQGRVGQNKKDIFVTANTEGKRDHTLHFDVEVVKSN